MLSRDSCQGVSKQVGKGGGLKVSPRPNPMGTRQWRPNHQLVPLRQGAGLSSSVLAATHSRPLQSSGEG